MQVRTCAFGGLGVHLFHRAFGGVGVHLFHKLVVQMDVWHWRVHAARACEKALTCPCGREPFTRNRARTSRRDGGDRGRWETESQILNRKVNYKTPVILRKPLALASPLIQHYTLKLYKCMASQVRAGSNRRFLVLGLGWLSLESVGMWYKQRQLYKTTAPPPFLHGTLRILPCRRWERVLHPLSHTLALTRYAKRERGCSHPLKGARGCPHPLAPSLAPTRVRNLLLSLSLITLP